MGILRRDTARVIAAMEAWEFFEAQQGTLSGPLRGSARQGVNSLWVRRRGEEPWALELMLDEAEADQWVFRRDHTIRRPLTSVVRHDADGIPYLAPEIQLLYKAKHLRAEDELDFQRVAVHLGGTAREWLRGALRRLEPQHRWLAALSD